MLSDSLPPPGSTVAPHANFRGQWRTRVALLLFHITIVVAAISLTPAAIISSSANTQVPRWSLVALFSGGFWSPQRPDERRIGGVSSGAARDFRSGFESTRPAFEEQMKVMQDYFTATDQLAEFLIHQQGQYSQTRSPSTTCFPSKSPTTTWVIFTWTSSTKPPHAQLGSSARTFGLLSNIDTSANRGIARKIIFMAVNPYQSCKSWRQAE